MTGKTLLHLQCHFGHRHPVMGAARRAGHRRRLLAGLGQLARELAAELGFRTRASSSRTCTTCRSALEDEFDVVYTSRGVLGWLPDIRAGHGSSPGSSRPAAIFFITEAHPVIQVFENEGVAPGELRLAYPYWEHESRSIFDGHGSYADPTADVGEETEHGWDHGLGEIVTALIDAGLRDRAARGAPVPRLAGRFPRRDARRALASTSCPMDAGELPLMFSLLASKPA